MGAALLAPLLVSAVGGGISYVNQKQANNRAQGVEAQNIMQQNDLADEANSGAKALANNIANSSSKGTANQETGAFVKALRANAAGSQTGKGSTSNTDLFGQPVSALPSTSVGSSRYKADTANDSNQVQQYGSDLATTMGNISAPVIQRQEEGLGMQNYATGLGLLNGQSSRLNFTNRLRAASAGQANPYASLLGNLMQGAGSAWSKQIPSSSYNPGTTYPTSFQTQATPGWDT